MTHGVSTVICSQWALHNRTLVIFLSESQSLFSLEITLRR